MKRLILFAHYDRDRRVRPFVYHHLEALGALGGTLVFLSNSPVSGEDRARLAPLVDRIHLRANAGFDFGMWQDGVARLDGGAWDELVLVNSSVVGPLHPLEPVFQRMAGEDCDFWGMTESWQTGSRHLQSYFLVFRQPLLATGLVQRFFESVLPYQNKRSVILAYEVGLTAFLEERGFRGAAAFPLERLEGRTLCRAIQAVRALLRGSRRKLRREQINPSSDFALALLLSRMPYLKAEILRQRRLPLRHLPLRRLLRRSPLALRLCQDV